MLPSFHPVASAIIPVHNAHTAQHQEWAPQPLPRRPQASFGPSTDLHGAPTLAGDASAVTQGPSSAPETAAVTVAAAPRGDEATVWREQLAQAMRRLQWALALTPPQLRCVVACVRPLAAAHGQPMLHFWSGASACQSDPKGGGDTIARACGLATACVLRRPLAIMSRLRACSPMCY